MPLVGLVHGLSEVGEGGLRKLALLIQQGNNATPTQLNQVCRTEENVMPLRPVTHMYIKIVDFISDCISQNILMCTHGNSLPFSWLYSGTSLKGHSEIRTPLY